jgi:hypothetical protein
MKTHSFHTEAVASHNPKLHRALLVAVALLATFLALPGWASTSFYNQPFDQTGNGSFSQNDTNGFGEYAITYDDFSVNISDPIQEVRWVGGYYNPPAQGQITGWNIGFYSDNNGQPGALLSSTHVAGSGNETFVGYFGAAVPMFSYDVSGLNFAGCSKAAQIKCWMSVVPDLGYPPQWEWASGNGGDGVSYLNFFGDSEPQNMDMAFELLGGQANTPEPGGFALLATAAVSAIGALKRRLKA